MVHSKILVVPEFPKLPRTDAADVNENIDLWIDDNREGRIKSFLIKDEKGHRGYRFVRSSDLESIINTEQEILGIKVKLEFKRGVETRDSFCPLWFSECYGRSSVMFDLYGREFMFKSDNDLKNKIREFKRHKKAALEYALTLAPASVEYIGAKLWGKFNSVLNIKQCSAIAKLSQN